MARPRKTKFPIGHEEMLRIVLPKKIRPEDRMEIFRAWSRANLTAILDRVPTEEEAQTEFALWCRYKWKHMLQVNDTRGDLIKRFLPYFYARKRKKRALSGAAARWKKGAS